MGERSLHGGVNSAPHAKGPQKENVKMEIGLYFCECGAVHVSDVPLEMILCPKCDERVQNELYPTIEQMSQLFDLQIEQLWNCFTKIQFDKFDQITEQFLMWQPATNRFSIWLWFAKLYSGNLTDLIGKLTWLEVGHRMDCICDCGNHIAAGNSCFLNHKTKMYLCDLCGKKALKDIWLFEGYRNPWIRSAYDPPFNRESFTEVSTIDELVGKFQHCNWNVGKAFVYKNVVFINQVDGGDEWMAIKDWCPFDSITFGAIFKRGSKYTHNYIEGLLKYKIDKKLMGPDYTIIEALI